MAKRTRSPNYPSMSFPEAIDLVKRIHAKAGTHKTSKESLVHILGYAGINGRSSRVLGGLNGYGLLEGRGDQMGLSEHGENIAIYRQGDHPFIESAKECITSPIIFREIYEEYNGSNLPSDEVIKPFLLKKGFSYAAAESLLDDLRATFDFLKDIENQEDRADNEPHTSEERYNIRVDSQEPRLQTPVTIATQGERELFSYDFEPKGTLRLLLTEDVDTAEALDILGDLVEMKKKEIARKAGKKPSGGLTLTRPTDLPNE